MYLAEPPANAVPHRRSGVIEEILVQLAQTLHLPSSNFPFRRAEIVRRRDQRTRSFDRHHDHRSDATLRALRAQQADQLIELRAFRIDATLAFEAKTFSRNRIDDVDLGNRPRSQVRYRSRRA